MTDPILVAQRLPKLAERAMRAAILRQVAASDRRRLSQRALVDEALIAFERLVQRDACDGIRPALLFAERDRIVRELRAFVAGRVAYRFFALRRRDIVAFGRDAAPFDAIVRGRGGQSYAIAFRRLASGNGRLEAMHALRSQSERGRALSGVLVYDFTSGSSKLLRCGAKSKNAAA